MTRKGQLRQRAKREHSDLKHLVARRELFAGHQVTAIRDDDDARRCLLLSVIHVEHGFHRDAGTDLFAALACDGVRRAFIVVDKSTRQAPEPVAWLDSASSQDNAPVCLDDDCGGDLRVVPQDKVIVRARVQLATFDQLDDERRAALDAVRHRRRA